jgi:hypothetical protein
MNMAGAVEPFHPSTTSGSAPNNNVHAMDTVSGATWAQPPSYYLHTRQSLPTLYTRSSWMDNNFNTYENSPIDAYTYASSSIPHQDTFVSSGRSVEKYRSWSTTTPMLAPVTASFSSEQTPSYSFGRLSVPFSPRSTTRLPSVTAEAFSPLNMTSMQTSLPTGTAQERRLPVPYTIQYPPSHSASQIPEVRPLGSYSEPRLPTHGIHSRTAMPWSADIAEDSTCTAPPASTYTAFRGLPTVQTLQPHQQQQQQQRPSIAPIIQPAFGYHFSHASNIPTTTSSPDPISSTTVAAASQSYTDMMLPTTATTTTTPPTDQLRCTSTPSYQSLLSITTTDRYPSPSLPPPSREGTQSLYTFSTDTGQDGDASPMPSNALPPIIHLDHAHACAPLRAPQPHSGSGVTNVEALCRHASSESLHGTQ